MRRSALLILPLLTAAIATGCASASREAGPVSLSSAPASPEAARSAAGPTENQGLMKAGYASPAAVAPAATSDVSLDQAGRSQAAAEAFDRKVIRNAEIALEVDDPAAAQQKIAALAEANGGFVVTSEISQAGSASPTVTVVMRVPAERFGPAVEALRAVGTRVAHEKITGQDVTEEFIDLEARVRTKQALEAQFLDIMKQAHTVQDALEVQRQLAEVRSEIEQLEGRRRYLENQSSLSTVTATLQVRAPIVTTTGVGFGDHLRRAFGDSVDTASAIVLGFIRLVAVAVPVLLLIVLPGFLIVRLIVRWLTRRSAAAE
jgi:hypothetical protein